MACFTASLPGPIGNLRAHPAAVTGIPARAHVAPSMEGRAGPGWFDSSWDLRCGLDVREGLPGDAKLHEWIDVCLRA